MRNRFIVAALVAVGTYAADRTELVADDQLRLLWILVGLLALWAIVSWAPVDRHVGRFIPRVSIYFDESKPKTTSASESVAAVVKVKEQLRVLERCYLALASLRDHVQHMKKVEELGKITKTHVPLQDFTSMQIALEKIRRELIDQSPNVLPVSVAVGFQKPPEFYTEFVTAEERILPMTEDLMDKVLGQWQRYGERVGITPLKFRTATIVKLQDE